MKVLFNGNGLWNYSSSTENNDTASIQDVLRKGLMIYVLYFGLKRLIGTASFRRSFKAFSDPCI